MAPYRELLSDTNFQKSLHCVAEEPIPYFTQLSTQPIATNESTQDNATRHIYASGLERLPSVVESVGHESFQSSQNQNEDNIIAGDSESSIGLPEPPPPLSSLSASDKVGNKIKKYTIILYEHNYINCFFLVFQSFIVWRRQ